MAERPDRPLGPTLVRAVVEPFAGALASRRVRPARKPKAFTDLGHPPI